MLKMPKSSGSVALATELPGKSGLVAPPSPEYVGMLSRACADMPGGVVCLLTAAHLQGLLPAPPPRPWIAIQQGANGPRTYETWQVIRWSHAEAFQRGVLEDCALGAPVRRTGPARTVVDLIRCARYFRGIQPGVDAARRYVAAGGDPKDLSTIAQVLPMTKGSAAHLEAIVCTLQGPFR